MEGLMWTAREGKGGSTAMSLVILSLKKVRNEFASESSDEKFGRQGVDLRDRRVLSVDHKRRGLSEWFLMRLR